VPAVVAWFVRACVSPLYYREARYIVARKIPAVGSETESLDGQCLTVESLEALRAVEGEIPPAITYSLKRLRQYLAQGAVLFLIFRPKGPGQERAFVGYGIDQSRVLSVLRREKAAPFRILFTRYGETLPAYRGQRYNDTLRVAREEYCRKHALQFICGTVAPDNRSSLSVAARVGFHIVGTAVRVSILRGRFVWETPWERIEAALQNFLQQESHS
jgi:hypothetical protein